MPKKYNTPHRNVIVKTRLSNAASKYFRDHGITKLPSTKALQAEIQQFTSEQNARYKDYREKRDRVEELERVRSNLEERCICRISVAFCL